MGLTAEERKHFEALRRKKGVHFKGSIGAAEWPENHRRNFAAIQSLGDLKFDEYSVDDQTKLLDEPWKNRVKEVAAELTERAIRCCRRNEASWRFACEPVIFARMNAEAACQNCRGRLWRSEIEVSWEGSDRRADALRKRQESRRPCRCLRYTRPHDPHEAIGLNRIFTHREEEVIIHHPELAREVKKSQHPDRVYGLRQTRNFEEALYSQASCASAQFGTLVLDQITVSPLLPDGDPLLFPFLILEAKSGKSEDDWHSIKLQTAFPILTCLNAQHSVQLASGNKCRWESGPLVWFFMNKGEDWRLCAAYLQTSTCLEGQEDTKDYCIIDLWNGSIITKDGALQLLLIVDYIFDWARDSFRQNILTELRTMSGVQESATIFSDSDLMSTRGVAVSIAADNSVGGDHQKNLSLRSFVHQCDSTFGMVRDAAYAVNRFCMLFITRDNVQTLIQSTAPGYVQRLARLILAQISTPVFLMDSETLGELEEEWTGTTRLSRSSGLNDTKFFTSFTFATYMSPVWVQLREICLIAVAEDAFDSVVAGSKLQAGSRNTQKPAAFTVDKFAMKRIASDLQAGTPRQTLLAAIKRILLRFSPPTLPSLNHYFTATLDDGTLPNIVDYVSESSKKGVLEPTESFLRVSSRHVQIGTESVAEDFDHPYAYISRHINEVLQVSWSGAVLIHGSGTTTGIPWSETSRYCIYFVGSPIEAVNHSIVAAAIKNTFENFDVYHTTRNNRTANIKSTKYSSPSWNLGKVYGIYTMDHGFVKWLGYLGSAIPTRQGSPRDHSGSGSNLLTRNITLWQHPNMGGGRHYDEIFLLYKLMTTELLYWRGVAQERKQQGIICCHACATQDFLKTTSEPILCSRCWGEIQTPRFPRWVSDTLVGNRPIKWTRVEEEKYSSTDRILSRLHLLDTQLIIHNPSRLPRQEQWYKEISEYPYLDKDYVNIRELYAQAADYLEWAQQKYWGHGKRSRSPDESYTERRYESSFAVSFSYV